MRANRVGASFGAEEVRMETDASPTDLQRAEHHAAEAERLLKGKLGIVTNYVKAQVHATLAVYYSGRAR
jgi:hypothetical protein